MDTLFQIFSNNVTIYFYMFHMLKMLKRDFEIEKDKLVIVLY